MPNRNIKYHTIDQGMKHNDFIKVVKVVIVGDNHIVRSGLRRILETQSAICVLGDVTVKEATVGAITDYSPNLVLVDLDSHGTDVLECIGALHDASEKFAVLILIELADHELARKALTLGASGIVLKMQPPAVLIAAIRELCPFGRVISMPRSGQKDDAQSRQGQKSTGRPHRSDTMVRVESLTARERDIIRLLGRGLRNKDIANRLSISDITVRHHLTSIFSKLEIEDRQKLLILAHRYGLVELGWTEPAEASSPARSKS